MRHTPILFSLALASSLLILTACDSGSTATDNDRSLQDVYADAFLMGVALNEHQVSGALAGHTELALKHFNSITPENEMKWDHIHPLPGQYNFGPADSIVEFAEANELWIVGHTLVWHSQTPGWVFEDDNGERLSREAMIERMRDHIHTVVGRYKGRVQAWDVVNEVIMEDGSLRRSPWYQIIGEDYIDLAFQFAHEADPEAELYYNDYTLNFPAKRAATIEMIRSMQERGIPIHGVGTQEHIRVEWPSLEDIEQTIVDLHALGIKVMVTELDIDVLPPAFDHMGADVNLTAELRDELNPFTEGLPEAVQKALAQRYGDVFNVYWRLQDKIDRITIWGLTDGTSWLNYWPVRTRINHPLLWDREMNPKPALEAVLTAPDRE